MPRVTYDPKTKAAILAAAKGKKLKLAYEAAKDAGYKGGMQSLYMMLRNSGVTRRKRRNTAAAAEPVVRSSTQHPGLSDIGAVIEAEIQARVKAALAVAIAELQKTMS